MSDQRGANGGAIDRLRTEATGPLGFDPDSPMARDILTLIDRAEAADRERDVAIEQFAAAKGMDPDYVRFLIARSTAATTDDTDR